MAQKTIIQLVDDLDGSEIAEGKGETVSFALDGTEYQIDLTNKNADKFRGLLMDYIAAGTKVGKTTKRGGAKTKQSGPSAAEVRDWAKSNGIEVPDRGRIPQEVWDKFNAA